MSEIVFSEQQIIYICVGIVIDGVVLLALIFMIYFFRKEYNKVKELEKIKSEKKSSKRNASSSSSGRFLVPEDTKYIEKASSDEYTPTPVVQPSQEQVAEKQAGAAAPDNQGEPIPESQVTPVPESEPVPENDSFVPPAENQTPQTPAAAPSPAPGPSTAPAPAPGPGAENQQVIVVQPGIRIVKRQVKLRISQVSGTENQPPPSTKKKPSDNVLTPHSSNQEWVKAFENDDGKIPGWEKFAASVIKSRTIPTIVNSLRGREFVIPKKEDFEPLDMASLNENLIKHLFKYGFINENERQEMFGFFDFSLPRDVEQQEILWYQTDKEDFYLRYQQWRLSCLENEEIKTVPNLFYNDEKTKAFIQKLPMAPFLRAFARQYSHIFAQFEPTFKDPKVFRLPLIGLIVFAMTSNLNNFPEFRKMVISVIKQRVMNTIYVNKLENRVYDMFYPFPQVWKAMELFPSSFENLEEAQNLLLEQEAIFKKKMKNKPRRGSVNDENNTSEDNQA